MTGTPRARALGLIGEVTAWLADALPQEMERPSLRSRVALWVMARSLARYATIGHLIRLNQHDDALLLLRPLLSDAERMQFVGHADPDQRDALMVAWVDHALSEWVDVAAAAARSGEAEFASAIREMVDQSRVGLDTARPAGTRRRMLKEGAGLMRAVGRQDDEVDYVLATKSSHGVLTSTFRHLEATSDGIVFSVTDPDPMYPLGIARRSTRHIARLCHAGAIVAELANHEAIGEYATEAEARLDAEEAERPIE